MNLKQKALQFSKQLILCSILTFSLASFFFINQVESQIEAQLINQVEQVEMSQKPLKQELNAIKHIALKIKQLVLIVT